MHHEFPMNRWFVSRWLRSASAQDFTTAVQSMHEAMEHMSGRKYDLKVTFYRAANPAALQFADTPAPDQPICTIDNLRDLRARDFNKADYVRADLTPTGNAPFDLQTLLKPAYRSATITARWPDQRRIDFEIQPVEHGRKISRHILNTNFTLWTRGYDFG